MGSCCSGISKCCRGITRSCRCVSGSETNSMEMSFTKVSTPSHAWSSPFHKHSSARRASEPVIPPSWMDDSKGIFIYHPRKSFDDGYVDDPLPIDVMESRQLAEKKVKHQVDELRKGMSRYRRRNQLLTNDEYDKANRRPNTAQ